MFSSKLFLGLLVFVFLSGLSQSESDGDKKIESELDALAEQLDSLQDKADGSGIRGLLKKLKSLREIFHKHGADDVKKGTIKKLKGKYSQISKDETTKAKLIKLLKKRGGTKTLTEDDWKEVKVIADDYYQRNPVVHTEVKNILKSKKSSGKFTKIIKAILKLPLKIAKWVYNIIVAFVGEAIGLALLPVGVACGVVFGAIHFFTLFHFGALGDLATVPIMVAFGLTMFSLTPSDKNFMKAFMIGRDEP
ncbi:uncharacterized protein LOC141850914 [Brevipalpus obovatus]|uniref:uncharacterized protein LOC141850914 n=1 Tax=Brevipalpus obovatus TaxID=246614 RepID=UPI003D9EA353